MTDVENKEEVILITKCVKSLQSVWKARRTEENSSHLVNAIRIDAVYQR